MIADRAMFIDFDHGVVEVERPIRQQGIYKRDVEVGSNVWIGYGACVLRGVRVGDNSIVGTNSVVTKDVPANAVVGGIPARVLRMREAPRELRWKRPVEPDPEAPTTLRPPTPRLAEYPRRISAARISFELGAEAHVADQQLELAHREPLRAAGRPRWASGPQSSRRGCSISSVSSNSTRGGRRGSATRRTYPFASSRSITAVIEPLVSPARSASSPALIRPDCWITSRQRPSVRLTPSARRPASSILSVAIWFARVAATSSWTNSRFVFLADRVILIIKILEDRE